VGTKTAPASSTASSVEAQPHYVYGVVRAAEAPRPAKNAGIGGAEVGTTALDDVAALTSPLESATVRARRRDLMIHSDVLAAALERGTVVPLQFGTVFENAEAVVSDFLEPRRKELTTLLDQLEGRVELRVKAFYVEDAILAEIVRESSRIARLREATRAGPEAATHGARLELGELVAAELQARARRDAERIHERLRPLTEAVEVAAEPIEHEVLRASFLVARKNVASFDNVMNDIARREEGRIHFKYVGPLPPHSFVSLEGRAR
jgi:gas vesicle protein GvpL/GvpF